MFYSILFYSFLLHIILFLKSMIWPYQTQFCNSLVCNAAYLVQMPIFRHAEMLLKNVAKNVNKKFLFLMKNSEKSIYPNSHALKQ